MSASGFIYMSEGHCASSHVHVPTEKISFANLEQIMEKVVVTMNISSGIVITNVFLKYQNQS